MKDFLVPGTASLRYGGRPYRIILLHEDHLPARCKKADGNIDDGGKQIEQPRKPNQRQTGVVDEIHGNQSFHLGKR